MHKDIFKDKGMAQKFIFLDIRLTKLQENIHVALPVLVFDNYDRLLYNMVKSYQIPRLVSKIFMASASSEPRTIIPFTGWPRLTLKTS